MMDDESTKVKIIGPESDVLDWMRELVQEGLRPMLKFPGCSDEELKEVGRGFAGLLLDGVALDVNLVDDTPLLAAALINEPNDKQAMAILDAFELLLEQG